eukprot:4349313-Pleurochrysis_carterae.AAC.1
MGRDDGAGARLLRAVINAKQRPIARAGSQPGIPLRRPGAPTVLIDCIRSLSTRLALADADEMLEMGFEPAVLRVVLEEGMCAPQ